MRVSFRGIPNYNRSMELHGTILNNLASAVLSARRLRNHPIHSDTLSHWTKLLHHARRGLAAEPAEPLLRRILELEKEIAERSS